MGYQMAELPDTRNRLKVALCDSVALPPDAREWPYADMPAGEVHAFRNRLYVMAHRGGWGLRTQAARRPGGKTRLFFRAVPKPPRDTPDAG